MDLGATHFLYLCMHKDNIYAFLGNFVYTGVVSDISTFYYSNYIGFSFYVSQIMDLGALSWKTTISIPNIIQIFNYQGNWFTDPGNGIFKTITKFYILDVGPYVSLNMFRSYFLK